MPLLIHHRAAFLVATLLVGACSRRSDAPLVLPATRVFDVRPSDPSTSAYRPVDATRGRSASRTLPLAVLGRLESAHQRGAIASVYLAFGEATLAEQALSGLPASPASDSDRAALLLVRGAAAAALELLDPALAAQPELKSAAWNRGLALAALHLDAGAASAFEAFAAAGEPGWSDEARARAAALRAGLAARDAMLARALAEGPKMTAGGAPLAGEVARAVPGMARLYLYDALRLAPDAARVAALRPLATLLDELDGTPGAGLMVAFVDRMAGADFARRAPLVAIYRGQVDGTAPLDLTAGTAFIARAQKEGALDLAQGMAVLSGLAHARPAEYAALVAGERDPWFGLLVDIESANLAVAQGRGLDAEAALLPRYAACRRRATPTRCLSLAYVLSNTARDLGHSGLAQRAVEWVLAEARLEGMGRWERVALNALGEDARGRGERAYLRAISQETIARPTDDQNRCRFEDRAHLRLSMLAADEEHVAAATEELALAPRCAVPGSFARAIAAADVAWLGRSAPDVARLIDDEVAKWREQKLPAIDQLYGDYLVARGHYFVERDASVAKMEAVLAQLATDPPPPRQVGVADDRGSLRAFVYTTLVVDASLRGDFARVVALAARERGLPVPARCAVVASIENRDLAVAIVDAEGRTSGTARRLEKSWTVDDDAIVAPAQRAALAACTHIQVLARPPLVGRPDLLPADVAWSYTLGATPAAAVPAPPARHVVIADVPAPAMLELATLAPWKDDPAAAPDRVVRGAEATPTRVLEAIADATLVEIHVHGRLEPGVSDTAHLVLAADADGGYALTAAMVRRAHLAGAPVVILGACEAAKVAPSLNEPTSLPLAFLTAGARAVIAATVPVPDDEAGPFFAAVARRVHDGQPPAEAVRDERRARGGGRGGWMREVLVFE